ncbi:MAG: hypothetical protein K8R92_00015 [Planctomycetes bacterium]|nr:hypothetical protein [Planctomycetota bacterium]
MATLATHIRCDRCKYDLHGLALLDVCPECGLAVATTLAGSEDQTVRSLVALQRPHRVAALMIAIPLACLLAAVLQSAGPLLAFIDSMSNQTSRFAEQVRFWGWSASFALVAVAILIAMLALLPAELSLRAEMRRWRHWLNSGLLLWAATLAAIIVVSMRPVLPRGVLEMIAPALQLPAFAITLISYRRLIFVCGRRSQAFREAGAARQKINLLIYALGLVMVGAIASPILRNRLGWDLVAVLADSLVVIETGILIFGLAYLVANAWWIAHSLLMPPMKFDISN